MPTAPISQILGSGRKWWLELRKLNKEEIFEEAEVVSKNDNKLLIE